MKTTGYIIVIITVALILLAFFMLRKPEDKKEDKTEDETEGNNTIENDFPEADIEKSTQQFTKVGNTIISPTNLRNINNKLKRY